jgi:hypothetical protein
VKRQECRKACDLFHLQCRYSPGETVENKISRTGPSGRDSNHISSEFES